MFISRTVYLQLLNKESEYTQNDTGKIDLQSVTKYLSLTLVFNYGKSLISIFQEFFARINKVFILAGRLHTKVLFYEV